MDEILQYTLTFVSSKIRTTRTWEDVVAFTKFMSHERFTPTAPFVDFAPTQNLLVDFTPSPRQEKPLSISMTVAQCFDNLANMHQSITVDNTRIANKL
jgi:hypothetical protein